jgi:23S rRNA (cytidine1920-2'-O)/16S rRNA (cytidine1409-2'-O)-methyltransferase
MTVSRSHAQGLIQSGKVFDGDGVRVEKTGHKYPVNQLFEVRGIRQYVSRGGEKLEAGLDELGVSVEGRVAIDIGASTGGFTDCLLQRGAARVYAVDVGYGQLAWKLRTDPRVVVLERTNIRYLTPDQMPELPDFFTADCSFISLRLVLPPLRLLLSTGAEGVVLIKPQFEAGRDRVGKGGVVRDHDVRLQTVDEVLNAAAQLGFNAKGVIESPLLGPAGNHEFLARLIFTGNSQELHDSEVSDA